MTQSIQLDIKYGESLNYKYVVDTDAEGNIQWGQGHREARPGYDHRAVLTLMDKGVHKGEVRIEVGSFPQEGFSLPYNPGIYSTAGKKKTKMGYVSLDDLRSFVAMCELEDVKRLQERRGKIK